MGKMCIRDRCWKYGAEFTKYSGQYLPGLDYLWFGVFELVANGKKEIYTDQMRCV